MTILGVYWAPGHQRPSDIDYMRRLQPPAIRVLDPDVNQIAIAYQSSPGSLILPRDWALSEQHDDVQRDPVGTGKRHARDWREKVNRWRSQGAALPPDDRIIVVGINEPKVWEMLPQVVEYTVAWLDECTALGLRACALNLSVGWPANTGPDTPPDWSPYAPIEAAITRGDHFLVLHEYWYRTGPRDGWGWYAGRLQHCPWDVPVIIGECGIDMYVDMQRWQNDGKPNRGWRGNVDGSTYAQQIEDYARAIDSRVVAILPFLTDYRSNNWESFDTAEAHPALLSRASNMVPQAKPPASKPDVPPSTIHLPSVGTGQPAPAPTGIIDPRVLQAILKIESGGRALGTDGKPIIRFESHIFEGKAGDTPYFRSTGAKPWQGQQWRRSEAEPWRDIHTGHQADEYAAFEFAKTINRDAAHQAISVGAGQIMGFNAGRVGYPSAEAMFNAFHDPLLQTIGFINYFLGDPALVDAVRRKDWREIAKRYNGAGAVDTYAPLLERAYEEASKP